MKLIKRLACTDNSIAPLVARLTLGLVVLPHGLQKTLGMFGGYGFSGTMGFFTGNLGLPWLVAALVIAAESLGAISLLLGFMTRFCAFGIGLTMAGAIFFGHLQNGFFMNWFGNQSGEGYEYHLLIVGIAVSLLFSGAGALSVDRKISQCKNC